MLDPDQLQYVHRVWQVPSEVDSGTQPPNWEAFVDGLAEHGSAYDSTNRLHLQGQNRFRYLNSIARASLSADLTGLTSGAFNTVTWDQEDFDTDTVHSTASNTSRLTAQIDGKYIICANAQVTGDAGSTLSAIRFIKNGSATPFAQINLPPDSAHNIICGLISLQSLVAGDYVEMQAYSDSTNPFFVESSNGTNFSLVYVGE